jgi:hypothetical protein
MLCLTKLFSGAARRTATLGISDGLRRQLDQSRSRCGSGVERR